MLGLVKLRELVTGDSISVSGVYFEDFIQLTENNNKSFVIFRKTGEISPNNIIIELTWQYRNTKCKVIILTLPKLQIETVITLLHPEQI